MAIMSISSPFMRSVRRSRYTIFGRPISAVGVAVVPFALGVGCACASDAQSVRTPNIAAIRADFITCDLLRCGRSVHHAVWRSKAHLALGLASLTKGQPTMRRMMFAAATGLLALSGTLIDAQGV